MTGFRVLSNPIRAMKVIGAIRAGAFKPEVKQFLSKSLSSAVGMTPMRNGNTIRAAQKKQYAHRINYIPSFHTLENPSLIVNEDGEYWLSFNSKWYRPDIWHIPDEAWSAYEMLMAERERRMRTAEGEFIESRMQARFLYRKSWWEIGQSAGVSVSVSGQVSASVTRRKPPLNPPKGYAQERGGKDAFSILIRNPFLDQVSGGGQSPLSTQRYKDFNGQDIIERAMAMHRPAFQSKVAKKAEGFIMRALRSIL